MRKLIDVNGANAQRITEATGCTLWISLRDPEGNTLSIPTLEGSLKEALDVAKELFDQYLTNAINAEHTHALVLPIANSENVCSNNSSLAERFN